MINSSSSSKIKLSKLFVSKEKNERCFITSINTYKLIVSVAIFYSNFTDAIGTSGTCMTKNCHALHYTELVIFYLSIHYRFFALLCNEMKFGVSKFNRFEIADIVINIADSVVA